MGKRAAAQAGIGFVAVTRVKHPSHLIFEQDLPEWEAFQQAQWKPAFRARRRFELRMQAKASYTLRKYRFCEVEGEGWTEEEAALAEELLAALRQVAALRRSGLRLGPRDRDAWLWGGEKVP